MLYDFAKNYQIGFQDPATPLAEGIIDLHNSIFFWLILILTSVVIIFFRLLKRSYNVWDKPSMHSILVKRKQSFFFHKIIHGTLLEIIWTITPTIILVLIAVPSFGLIYAMDSIQDPDWTIKVIGNQWYWSFDFNFGAFLMKDIQNLYLATFFNLNNKPNLGVANALANTTEMERIVVENTIKLWKHNVKHYLIDSYTLTENNLSKHKAVRLLSTDNPLFVPINQNIRVF